MAWDRVITFPVASTCDTVGALTKVKVVPLVNFVPGFIFSLLAVILIVAVLLAAEDNVVSWSAFWSQSPSEGINVFWNGNSTSTDSLNNNLKNISILSELPLNL